MAADWLGAGRGTTPSHSYSGRRTPGTSRATPVPAPVTPYKEGGARGLKNGVLDGMNSVCDPPCSALYSLPAFDRQPLDARTLREGSLLKQRRTKEAGAGTGAGEGDSQGRTEGEEVAGEEEEEEEEAARVARRVTLIGDACHPMSPFKGQGANQAVVDGLCLARHLAGHLLHGPSHDTTGAVSGASDAALGDALAAFEAEMLERSAAKVRGCLEAPLPAALTALVSCHVSGSRER